MPSEAAKQRGRERSLARYHRLKAEGGEAWAEFRRKQQIGKRAWEKKRRAAGLTIWRDGRRKPLKTTLIQKARKRGREAGMGATITAADIVWPTHCPVLGIELDYDTPVGSRKLNSPNCPSLDRWDNSKGYVPGNVYVISLRANQLKGNATPAELAAIANYALHGVEIAKALA